MKRISYSGYRFPPEIIQQAIWLYLRFTLSLRDVEDLLDSHSKVLQIRDRQFPALKKLANATRRPSGRHSGANASSHAGVSRRSWVPSACEM